ncbi:conserved hypothetical protein [Shewanella halifaxensis HAW-EB4]|uniref:Methyl-accepting chemotaxis sensory transducer n=1 Tax=Shewanella halifaxensis (strain HAW-EB4) TaxID=458817 RepID=B0TKT9_SHEHH|nr:hypothetical protein [Shewanella halifaxensis]ABZ75891.1 conserved hypothetical protein [Shewanella halifaxensis HAW-EB4]
MSAIADFKKRCDAEKAKQAHDCAEHKAVTAKPANEALALLAYLLGCEEEQAIEKAHEAVAQKARFVDMQIHVDPATGDDKSVTAEVTTDEDGRISQVIATDIQTELEHSADTVADAAHTVEQAAGKVETAANDVSEASSDLAYNAETISEAASDIKEAASEIKKPSAELASSPGEKDAKAKSSSKK